MVNDSCLWDTQAQLSRQIVEHGPHLGASVGVAGAVGRGDAGGEAIAGLVMATQFEQGLG